MKDQIQHLENQIHEIGGRNCGWLEEEQRDFLILFNKHQKNLHSLKFRLEVEKNFPLFNDTEISFHIETFENYQQLEKKKKEMLKVYKEKQKQQNQKEMKQISL